MAYQYGVEKCYMCTQPHPITGIGPAICTWSFILILQKIHLSYSYPLLKAPIRWLLVSHPPPASLLGCRIVSHYLLCPCSEDHVMLKSDDNAIVHYALLLKTTHKLQSLTNLYNKGDRAWRKRLWVKEVRKKVDLNKIYASVTNNDAMVIPSRPHHSHYNSWMRN